MNKNEVTKLIYVIKATYPNHYSRFTTRDFDNLISAWSSVLEDYTYEQGCAGLKIYLASDTKGFPPSPGQVIDGIHKLRPAAEDMTALEAWARVRKAVSNSGYHAEEEYAALPASIQRAIGNPANLREMAMMDTKTFETVEQSHFVRIYDAVKQREKDEAKIPARVLALINGMEERRIAVNE